MPAVPSSKPAPAASDGGIPFADPPWDAPLDVSAVIAAIPGDVAISGMFFSYLVTGVQARGITLPSARDRYTQFSFYPVTELARLHVEAAERLYPGQPLREGLRRLGKPSARAFLTSTLGKVTLGSAEGVAQVLEATQKAYELNLKPSAVRVLDQGASWATLRLDRVYHFLDSHHVGVLEGLLGHAKVDCRVRIASRSGHSADFLLTW